MQITPELITFILLLIDAVLLTALTALSIFCINLKFRIEVIDELHNERYSDMIDAIMTEGTAAVRDDLMRYIS